MLLCVCLQLCRSLDCGRVTSCKSGKDRTGMSVTLEQANILVKELDMDPQCFQQAIDAMRRQEQPLKHQSSTHVDPPPSHTHTHTLQSGDQDSQR